MKPCTRRLKIKMIRGLKNWYEAVDSWTGNQENPWTEKYEAVDSWTDNQEDTCIEEQGTRGLTTVTIVEMSKI